MRMPALIRNVAVVGHLAHGKTSLVDSAIAATHGWGAGWDPHPDETRRYTDARADEQARGCSVKSTPVSLVLQVGARGRAESSLNEF
jgi:U5 small nuclear ribonucleoprotein component